MRLVILLLERQEGCIGRVGVAISCRKMLGYHQPLPVALIVTPTKIGCFLPSHDTLMNVILNN